jgi:predicted nucleic acid-binding protein
MEVKYLLDTNTTIDYLDNKLPIHSTELIDKITIYISVISRMELLVWPNASIDHLQILNLFIKASVVYNLDEAIILKTVELRKTYKIKLPDAIIASTAIIHGLILISRNLKDFNKITDLKTIDPHLIKS